MSENSVRLTSATNVEFVVTYDAASTEPDSGANGGGRTLFADSFVVGRRHRSLLSFATMKITRTQFRGLLALAVIIFVASAVSEVATESRLPQVLQEWKASSLSVADSYRTIGSLIALVSIGLGLVGYIAAFLIKKWGGVLLLAHAVLFFVSNYFLSPHVYTGITQVTFLVYVFLVGVIVAYALQGEGANQTLQGTAAAPRS